MWGHHPAFGAPFLKSGLTLIVPAKTGIVHSPLFAPSGILEPGKEFSWPNIENGQSRIDLSKVPGPEAGFSELIYLKELSAAWYAVLKLKKKLELVFPGIWIFFHISGSGVYMGNSRHTPGGIVSIVWHWSHGQASPIISMKQLNPTDK